MKIFGKSISDYLKFEKWFLILILAIGFARLGMSMMDVPNSTTKFLSLTVVLLLGTVFYSVTVHTSGFGSYKQLLPVLEFLSITGGCIIIAGIVISILTGKANIFSAPEYSGGGDGKTWAHAGAHFVVMFVAPLILWLIGALIMFVTKKITGTRAPGNGAAAA